MKTKIFSMILVLVVTTLMIKLFAVQRENVYGIKYQALLNNSQNSPRELGRVKWLRGFSEAVQVARAKNKPLLVLFQEVPGCATCVNYGDRVLSHPLIVEAIESLFVPAVVYNNVKGEDKKTLKLFGEPAWNNPVVHIMTADRKEIAARVSGNYTVSGLSSAIVAALKTINRKVPTYLQLLSDESKAQSRKVERGTFAMYCFWSGEAALGALPGVVSTRPGFLHGFEVVEVEFDPTVLSYAELVKAAKTRQYALRVFTRNAKQQETAAKIVGNTAVVSNQSIRPDGEPKYYLSKTLLRYVPMTSMQASRVNAAIRKSEDPRSFLSPRQIKLLNFVKSHPDAEWKNAIGSTDLPKAWDEAIAMVFCLSEGQRL